jgi:hypothetical protein
MKLFQKIVRVSLDLSVGGMLIFAVFYSFALQQSLFLGLPKKPQT